MFRVERQAKILQMIKDRGFIETNTLINLFKVSLITIRRDLKSLSKQGLINVERGGASIIDYLDSKIEPLYEMKAYINVEKKEAIAEKAVELIKDSDTVILDSGTTNYRIACQIKKIRLKNITIFTNDIMTAKVLCTIPNIKVFIIGGLLRTSFYNTNGLFTEECLQTLKVNKVFLGVDAVSPKRCISNLQFEEVAVKEKMIEISDKVIMVADSSKFDIDAPYKVCNWTDIDAVITDDKIPRDYIEIFESNGIQTYIVTPSKTEQKYR
jgi:DeoR/GlpR family transcriptional regulator of sugar metabolism